MNAYVDSSVVLRDVFREARAFEPWGEIERAISSVLLHIECFRAVDRARLAMKSDTLLASHRDVLYDALERIELVQLTEEIVAGAARSMRIPLRALDAIHLSTALWRSQNDPNVTFITHDLRLARAAEVFGFRVLGV